MVPFLVHIFVLCCDLLFFRNGSIYTNDKDEQACPILPVCTLGIEFLCFFSLIVHILKVTVTMRCVFPPL